MGRKKNKRKSKCDEIELDLDKLSEYMHSLRPGQYADVSEMIEKCALDLKRRRLPWRGISADE